MFRRFTINFALLSMFLDAGFVIIALASATHLRPLMSKLPFAANIYQPLTIPVSLYIVFPFAWVGFLLLLSVYDGRRSLHVTDEIVSLTIGSVLASVFLAGTLYLSFRQTSRILFLAFVLLAFLFQFFWRMLIRLVRTGSLYDKTVLATVVETPHLRRSLDTDEESSL